MTDPLDRGISLRYRHIWAIMIMSYLARLLLMLPDLTLAESNRLAHIADAQKQESVPITSPSNKINYISTSQNQSIPRRKMNTDNISKIPPSSEHRRRTVPDITPTAPPISTSRNCKSINETLRKNLIQVNTTFLYSG